MAVPITETSHRLQLQAAFADEDDRTLSLDNPKQGITESEIHALEPLAEKVIIGDKFSAAFTRFKSAAYVSETITKLTF